MKMEEKNMKMNYIAVNCITTAVLATVAMLTTTTFSTTGHAAFTPSKTKYCSNGRHTAKRFECVQKSIFCHPTTGAGLGKLLIYQAYGTGSVGTHTETANGKADSAEGAKADCETKLAAQESTSGDIKCMADFSHNGYTCPPVNSGGSGPKNTVGGGKCGKPFKCGKFKASEDLNITGDGKSEEIVFY